METKELIEIPGKNERTRKYHRSRVKIQVKIVEKLNTITKGGKKSEASWVWKITFLLENANSYSFGKETNKRKLNESCNMEKLRKLKNLNLI